MRERRWPWVGTAVLLIAAAVAAAWSTYLHWSPCRGSLLDGSLVRGYQYGDPGFSDGCLRRMDAGPPFPFQLEPSEQTPWAAELGVLAMTLAATAWLVLVVGMRWSLRTKAVAVLPGLVTLTLAVLLALPQLDPTRSFPGYLSGWLVTPELAALVALVAIWAWQPEVQGRSFTRLLVVAWGTTAFGLVHLIADYAFMVLFSDANWDVPPLTGSVTAGTLLASAVITLTLAERSSPPPGTRTEDLHVIDAGG